MRGSLRSARIEATHVSKNHSLYRWITYIKAPYRFLTYTQKERRGKKENRCAYLSKAYQAASCILCGRCEHAGTIGICTTRVRHTFPSMSTFDPLTRLHIRRAPPCRPFHSSILCGYARTYSDSRYVHEALLLPSWVSMLRQYRFHGSGSLHSWSPLRWISRRVCRFFPMLELVEEFSTLLGAYLEG
jgi:hypothetical protein